MKYSKQRTMIEKIISIHQDHPSAIDVYDMIKKEYPKISLATVYRNLNAMADESIIRKIENPYGSDRYDFNVADHYHMFCKKCGNVYDISLKDTNIEKLILSAFGFHVSDLQIEGLCQDCINRKE